ncbi:MAG: hypothetical protein ACKVZJ_03405 [Phycisphaerales bacterium]
MRGTAEMLALAKRVTQVTECPVVGGLAVALHGSARLTEDIDIYSDDFEATHAALEAEGIKWNARKRQHEIDGVAVHMVDETSLGGPPGRTSTIRGVKVIGLADLVRGKLTVGLKELRRAKDIGDVVALIGSVPLDKAFAAKLPAHLRAPFKELVEQVFGPRRTTLATLAYYKKYA